MRTPNNHWWPHVPQRPPEETMARFYASIPWSDVHTVTAYRHAKTKRIRLRFTHTLAFAEAGEADAGFPALLTRLSQEVLPDFPVLDASTLHAQCADSPFETILWQRNPDERTDKNNR